MAKQIKLKSLLKEGYAWERKPGKPLPTIQEVMDEYEAKQTAEAPIQEIGAKGYSDEQVSKIGNEYKAFQKLLNSINYDDFMEYAEMSQDFNTLDILDYLKKKTNYNKQ